MRTLYDSFQAKALKMVTCHAAFWSFAEATTSCGFGLQKRAKNHNILCLSQNALREPSIPARGRILKLPGTSKVPGSSPREASIPEGSAK